MNEIVILSGKGGTGKTSITAAFATLSDNIILADCDVDAANLYIIMQPENYEEEPYSTGEKAIVDTELCNLCGLCVEYCRFDAMSITQTELKISTTACDGCKLCARVCPQNAISMVANKDSRFYIGTFRNGKMVHARLAPGDDNSGRMVSYVKQRARELRTDNNILLIDGPPGIGCPVIASLSGADKVVLVTEPTISGVSDLKRIISLLQKYKCEIFIIVNKHDINELYTNEIFNLAKTQNINFLGKIPYNRIFTEAMINCQSVIEYAPNHEISTQIKNIWQQLITKN